MGLDGFKSTAENIVIGQQCVSGYKGRQTINVSHQNIKFMLEELIFVIIIYSIIVSMLAVKA